MDHEYDVIVIGGGPGGAAAAITLAEKGYRVLVLEADHFPRPHVGESLVYLWSIFQALGVEEIVDRTFVHKRGASHVWGQDRSLWSVHFVRPPGVRNYSLLIHRATFDQLLLERARAVGATVWEGHRVTALHWERQRLRGVSYQSDAGATGTVRAPYVIDASGRTRLVARQLGLVEPEPFYPDLALYGYYQEAGRLGGEDAGNVLIEATPEGWVWHIPLHTGEVSIGVMVAQEGRARLRARGWREYFYEQVGQTEHIAGLLQGARLASGPVVGASASYRARRYAGAGWFLVGDAGAFIDPMWSSGVAIALDTGMRAGRCIDGILADRVSEPAAISYFNRSVRSRTCGLGWLIKQGYRANRLYSEAPFWQRCRRWSGARRPPAGLLAQLAGAGSLGYYKETLRLMGATNGAGRPLLDGIESFPDRRENFDWPTFLGRSLRLAPGVTLTRGAVLRGRQLSRGMALRLPADAGEVPLPDIGLDWPQVFARLATGAPVAAVVDQLDSTSYEASLRYCRQTETLGELYLEGCLTPVLTNAVGA